MAPNKAKQSGPTMVRERYVGYDRDTCITICLRLIRGEDIKAICTTPRCPSRLSSTVGLRTIPKGAQSSIVRARSRPIG